MNVQRILTPDEVRALQEPHVQARIARINKTLLLGYRSESVPTPMAEAIAAGLRASGWDVVVRTAFPIDCLSTLCVSEPLTADADLVAAGAKLLAEGR